MASWQDLEDELNVWREMDVAATFWWRDDDASKQTPALARLIDISNQHKVPIHLAVIPSLLEAPAVQAINAAENIWVLQHGFSHTDYAPKGEGSWELGDHRPISQVKADLVTGFETLTKAFATKFLPVQVPPWTRISANVAKVLGTIGFKALSLEGLGRDCVFAADIKIINPHCDPIKWKENARFKGSSRVLDDIISHLKSRRARGGDLHEATGICTHHLDHDDDLWAFLNQFADFISNNDGAQWIVITQELEEK